MKKIVHMTVINRGGKAYTHGEEIEVTEEEVKLWGPRLRDVSESKAPMKPMPEPPPQPNI